MNRPIGFDLADLTAEDARALRNTSARRPSTPQTRAAFDRSLDAHLTKRRRQQATRDALIDSVKVAGGALAVIGFVAWLGVWMAY